MTPEPTNDNIMPGEQAAGSRERPPTLLFHEIYQGRASLMASFTSAAPHAEPPSWSVTVPCDPDDFLPALAEAVIIAFACADGAVDIDEVSLRPGCGFVALGHAGREGRRRPLRILGTRHASRIQVTSPGPVHEEGLQARFLPTLRAFLSVCERFADPALTVAACEECSRPTEAARSGAGLAPEFPAFAVRLLQGQRSAINTVNRRLGRPLSAAAGAQLVAELRAQGASISAFSSDDNALSARDVLAHIDDDTTIAEVFLGPPDILVACAEGLPPSFRACWLPIDGARHLLVVSARLSDEERAFWLGHEMKHICDVTTGLSDASSLNGRTFAETQLDIESDSKRTIARYVCSEYPLPSNPGILLGTGTSALATWEELLKQLEDRLFAFPTVYTNNYLILESWRKHAHRSGVGAAAVHLLGTVLDLDNLEFLDESGDERGELGRDFRPSHVYIGAGGVQFESSGHIWLAYWGNSTSLRARQRMFRWPARRRFLLTTPGKLGQASGRVFDLLSLENLDGGAPLYVVTTEPTPERRPVFERELEAFRRLQPVVADRIDLHWITVAADGKVNEKLSSRGRPSLREC